ncbi:MAG: WYL domain-containing protein [Christensenellales bacterium]
MIPALKAAILNRQRLTFDYLTAAACARRASLPIRLWFKSSAWYAGVMYAKRALRTFKLTRIKRLRAIPAISRRGAGLHADRADGYSAGYAACPSRCASTQAWRSASTTTLRKNACGRKAAFSCAAAFMPGNG